MTELLKGSELEVIAKVARQHPEMLWLTGEVTASPETRSISDNKLSIGQQLFSGLSKDKVKEFDRTAVGILVLKWVLENNYERFTECQPASNQLSRRNFEHFRKYTLAILQSDEAMEAMITFIVINDLTKIKSVVSDIETKLQIEKVDHDVLLYFALREQPEISPSFMRLPTSYQQLMIEGLSATFNIGQMMQGENVAASLSGLEGLSKEALDFYLVHALCDIGGAGGQFAQNGSVVLTESTYSNFRMSIAALQGLKEKLPLHKVYDNYLIQKAEAFGVAASSAEDKVLSRLGCLFRIDNKTDFITLNEIFQQFDPVKKQLLIDELSTYGTIDGTAILIYYAPAIFNNINKNKAFNDSIEIGLTLLFDLYVTSRKHIRDRTSNGVFTVFASELAEFAMKTPEKILSVNWELSPKGDDAEINIRN